MLIALLLVVLLAATSFMALSEISLIASRHSRLDELKKEGKPGAGRALNLVSKPDWLLSTLEVSVTLISVVLGAVAEGTVAHSVETAFGNVPLVQRIGSHAIATAAVAVITYLTLICQVVPKRLALHNPEQFATAVSGPMSIIVRVLHPLVAFVNATIELVLRLFPQPEHRAPVTDAELLNLVSAGAKAGVFHRSEQQMFQSILRLESVRLSSIMIPRTQMQWLNISDDKNKVLAAASKCNLWQLPVIDGKNADHIVGVVEVREIMHALSNEESIDLNRFLRPALFVPDTEDALFLLQTFKQRGATLAILLDEFGGVTGVVSARAVVEEIVGDIGKASTERIKKLDGDTATYEVDGLTPINELAETLSTPIDQEDLAVSTVGGLVMEELGHLPEQGEELDWQNLHLTVISLHGHRIDKIRVTRHRNAA